MKCCINGKNFIRVPLVLIKLFKFEIQKYSQILCAHKPYFLMPDHIYRHLLVLIVGINLKTECSSYTLLILLINALKSISLEYNGWRTIIYSFVYVVYSINN